MPKRDLHSNIKAVQHLPAAVYTATQSPNGVDLRDFDSVDFLIAIGTVANIGTGSWTFKLQESDQQASGFTDVTDGNIVLTGSAASPVTEPDGSGVFLTVDDAAQDDAVYRVGYVGSKRYLRVVSTAVSTPGNSPIAIIALLGHPSLIPTSD